MCHKFIQLQNRLSLFTCLLCRNMVGALFASITSFKLGRITDADSVTRAGETSAVFLHSRLCNMLLWNLVALELCMQQGTSERKAVCLTTIATDESQHPNGLFDPKQNWLVSYFTRIFSGHFQASCALEVDQPTEVSHGGVFFVRSPTTEAGKVFGLLKEDYGAFCFMLGC